MKHLTKTPAVGQQLMYVHGGNAIPCEVVAVSAAAVYSIKLLAGGLNNSLEGKVIRVHTALLRTM